MIVLAFACPALADAANAADAADAWTVETVDGKPDLAAVWAAPGGKLVVAAGASGMVYRKDAAWTADKTTALVDFLDVTGTGVSDVWVTGAAGGMVHWDGSSWTSVQSESTGAYVALASAGVKAVCAIGKRISTWNGDVWRSVKDRPKINGLTAVTAVGAVGAKKPVFVTVGSGGQVWRVNGIGPAAIAKDEKPVTTGELSGVAACRVKGGDIVAVGEVAVMNRGGNGKWKVLAAPPVAVRGAVVKCRGAKATHVAAIAGDELLVLDIAKGAWTRETVQAGAALTDLASFGTGLIVSGKSGLIATRPTWP